MIFVTVGFVMKHNYSELVKWLSGALRTRSLWGMLFAGAIMIATSGCGTVQPPPPEVRHIAYQHRPKDAVAGPLTLTRDDFTQAELKTLDEFLESRAGKRLELPFTSLTVSRCGGCRTPGDHERGIRLNISGLRFCIPCEAGVQ